MGNVEARAFEETILSEIYVYLGNWLLSSEQDFAKFDVFLLQCSIFLPGDHI
jgi:hypothetical protein